jgi:serine/threonine protein phosphatase PrpC
MNLKAYAASVPQPGRQNEDAFFIDRLYPLVAVFDGQGNAENVAKKAARQLERLCRENGSKPDWTKTAKLLDSYLLGVNKSTMVAASLTEDMVSVCCVGDSRAYLVRNGQVTILTEKANKQKLGSGSVQPLVKQITVKDRDLVLLMTDGAFTPLSLYLLSKITVKNLLNLPELPHELLKQSTKAGIWDDATVVCMCIRG